MSYIALLPAASLCVAARLTLGDVLVRGQRLLVVLGDVLTTTDAGRLARVMGVLERHRISPFALAEGELEAELGRAK